MMNYLIYYTTTDGKVRYNITCLAFHIKRLQVYNEDWSLEQIIVYEALLVKSRSCGNDKFFYQQDRIAEDCNVSVYKVKQITEKLKKIDLISYKRGNAEKNFKYYYTINYETIKDNLELIYDFEVFSGGKDLYINLIKDFYDYHASGGYMTYEDIPEEALISITGANHEFEKRHKKIKRENGKEADNKYD